MGSDTSSCGHTCCSLLPQRPAGAAHLPFPFPFPTGQAPEAAGAELGYAAPGAAVRPGPRLIKAARGAPGPACPPQVSASRAAVLRALLPFPGPLGLLLPLV